MAPTDAELTALRALARAVTELLEDLPRELTHDGDGYEYPINSDEMHTLRGLVGAVERAQNSRKE